MPQPRSWQLLSCCSAYLDTRTSIETLEFVVLSLALAAIVWLLVIALLLNPARVWDMQRTAILSLMQQLADTRRLEDLIGRLQEQQNVAIRFLNTLQSEELVADGELRSWVRSTQSTLREAGPEHEAVYNSALANLHQAQNQQEILSSMIDVLTGVISSLAGQLRAMAAAVSGPV